MIKNVKDIKKIDIHAHAILFKEFYPPYIPGDSSTVFADDKEVLEFYDEIGIEKGVLLPIVSPEGQLSPMSSEACKYLSNKHPDRFYWFCNVDPRGVTNSSEADMYNILKHYKGLGAKGVGEITAHLPFDDPKYLNLFAACEKLDLPVIFHMATSLNWGYGVYDDLGLPRLEKVLAQFPKLKIIGHSHGFWVELGDNLTEQNRHDPKNDKLTNGGRVVELLRKYPNLYCDFSAGSGAGALMRDREFAGRFLEEFSDRVMYGCDYCMPGNRNAFYFRDFLFKLLDEGILSPENYKKLVRDNAIRILKLD